MKALAAVTSNNVQALEKLVASAHNASSLTRALHASVSAAQVSMVELLLKAGANPNLAIGNPVAAPLPPAPLKPVNPNIITINGPRPNAVSLAELAAAAASHAHIKHVATFKGEGTPNFFTDMKVLELGYKAAEKIRDRVLAYGRGLPAASDAACTALLGGQHMALIQTVATMPAACNFPNSQAGPHASLSPVHLAAKLGQMRALLAMLDMPGVEVDLPAGPQKDTPLVLAAAAGQARACTALLDRGADINAGRPSDGVTALHAAASAESLELVVLLASQVGVNINVQARSGDTPLHLAVARGGEAPVKVLLDAGADCDRLNAQQESALQLAIRGQHGGVMQMLIDDGGASLDLRLTNGSTALHTAAEGGHLGAVRALMQAGADHTLQNANGLRPSLVAKTDAIAELLEGGADQLQALDKQRGGRGGAKQKRAAKAPGNRVMANSRAMKDAAAKAQVEMPRRPVFLSFRVREARPQALALKAALEAQGIATFCSETDIPPSADWVKYIFQALAYSKVMVVLQSDTYGSPGTDVFATYEELVYAKKEGMPIYIMKMVAKVKEPGVQAMLNTLQGVVWDSAAAATPSQQLTVPSQALTDIKATLAQVPD